MTHNISFLDSLAALGRKPFFSAALMAIAVSAGASTAFAAARTEGAEAVAHSVQLPLIPGWYKGVQVFYLQTEASNQGLATSQQATYVPRLANAINANPGAVDDIYAVTNFTQSNIVPSAPIPEGPNNTDPDYTPLWRVSLVTWANPARAHTLKSEDEVKTAAAAGEVTLTQTNIVVNCPMIYSPQGGLFPQAKLIVRHKKDAD